MVLFLLVAKSVQGFYPIDYYDLSRLSGRAAIDSEEYYSKDETSRHDEPSNEDYAPAESRHYDDYSPASTDFSSEYDPKEGIHTRTYSSLFQDPLENDALYSSAKEDKLHKREEFFGGMSKKSMITFHSPLKISPPSSDDLIAGATDFNRPRSRRSRLSEYDAYYPKRQYHESPRSEYSLKSEVPSKSSDDYEEYPHTYPRYVKESVGPSEEPTYPTESYKTTPYYEPYPKPLSKPSKKTYPREGYPIKSTSHSTSSTHSGRKSKGVSSRAVGPRPSRPERESSKKYAPKLFSETKGRGVFDDDDDEEDFAGKPLVSTSWKKEKRQPKVFSKENKHFLSSTGYGKPVREQFHEQGTTGPHAYKFGYNTGDPENPMARYEERGADGVVKGSYSYVDPMGKLQVVHYESHPEHGFKTTYA
ncbi:uncharacterized protein TNIN_24991 [Trichonephila inaurata madagascariensis]|uniref:Uncharacterized protein n=1 Tax=Trichonephila inaurata madagascariensis TaxID=2747483 RepID=A0A8X6XVG3_9ARAC|nr:uncharacterized protein TNIN_24991 [Trichonephila inaurata madagascariensis]